jgi:lysozyme family protein
MFTRLDILGFWRQAKISDNRLAEVKAVADKIMGFRQQFYDPVAVATGVPWYGIATKDYREPEPAFNHSQYLGNGDPLSHKTTHVPRNRGPFLGPNAWQDGAMDAIHISGWDHLPSGWHWDIVTLLIKDEAFNGMGYAHMGLRSPYVFGGTNMQQRGKYTGDGHFDPSHWDTQIGTAAIYLALKEFHGIDLSEA